MKEVKFLTIDNRGRIVIPMTIRKVLGLRENSQLMLIADSDTKEMKISPVGIKGDSLKFRILMKDEAGSLAKIAKTFGNHGISLVYGESVTIERDKTAIWTVIGPRPKYLDLDELKGIIKKEGDAIEVEIIPLE